MLILLKYYKDSSNHQPVICVTEKGDNCGSYLRVHFSTEFQADSLVICLIKKKKNFFSFTCQIFPFLGFHCSNLGKLIRFFLKKTKNKKQPKSVKRMPFLLIPLLF